jgi:hypothetical protein
MISSTTRKFSRTSTTFKPSGPHLRLAVSTGRHCLIHALFSEEDYMDECTGGCEDPEAAFIALHQLHIEPTELVY